MEKAAMAAFKRDVVNDPSMAALYGVKIKDPENAAKYRDKYKAKAPLTAPPKKPQAPPKKPKKHELFGPAPKPPEVQEEWFEAKTEEGYSYYWNSVSAESTWERPTSGIVHMLDSIAAETESPGIENITATEDNPSSTIQETDRDSSIAELEDNGDEKVEDTAPTVDLKERSEESSVASATAAIIGVEISIKDIPIPGEMPAVTPSPAEVTPTQTAEPVPKKSRSSAYGSWVTVQKPKVKLPDLQLPKSNYEVNAPPQQSASPPDIPKFKFKEKIVTLSKNAKAITEPVSFKKRKMAGSRNIRRRDEED
ncbi:uncharacterized protein LOC141905008 isoform X1 [Tubulanus polymorphus]